MIYHDNVRNFLGCMVTTGLSIEMELFQDLYSSKKLPV
jgi:hypothetical protein